MAAYFRQTCRSCGLPARYSDKAKAYVHADYSAHDHAVGQPLATRLGSDAQEATA